MTCDRLDQVEAFHDGELSAADSAELAQHMQQCGACSARLDELRRWTMRLNEAPLPELPTGAIDRLYRVYRRSSDRAVLKVASWMTAAAAALLLGALWWRPARVSGERPAPAMWESIAVMPPGESQGDAASELVQVAQWMADDFSGGRRR